MKYEEKFNEVERQLIELPLASDAILSRAMRGEQFQTTLGGRIALDASVAQQMIKFAAPFNPPESVQRIAFPNENGGIDTVRLRYRAKDHVLTISHSRHVVAVAVRGYHAHRGESPLALATRAAKELFSPQVPIDLVELSPEASDAGSTSPAFGCQRDYPKPFTAVGPQIWIDYLCWWVRPQEVGFITLKFSGAPQGKGFVTSDPMENRNWFLRLEKHAR